MSPSNTVTFSAPVPDELMTGRSSKGSSTNLNGSKDSLVIRGTKPQQYDQIETPVVQDLELSCLFSAY
jgi:hypothetical protein